MPGRLTSQLEAFAEQSVVLADWLDGLGADDWSAPSVLDGWDVSMLVSHLTLVRNGLERGLGIRSEDSALSAERFVGLYRPAVEAIAENTRKVHESLAPPELVARLRDVQAIRTAGDGLTDRTVVLGGRGPIGALDWATTRLVEIVIHCDDLSRSLPHREPIALQRPALATAVRTLAEIFAANNPGRSVEVRIAPFVAVQAVAGPRHTRGTPPNVVETDPLTWVRLATGRVDFASTVASGLVAASGHRADLTSYLPVLS